MTTFVLWIVAILAVIAIVQLVRVHELARQLKGTREEVISNRDNRLMAWLMLLFVIGFFAYTIFYIYSYSDKLLPEAASRHGAELDALLNFNWVIILAIFFITLALLFFFAFKYYYRKDKKAEYFTQSHKLELIWTIVPAIAMAVIIVYGLNVWNKTIMEDAPEDSIIIELYSKQFDWTVRYAGQDNILGNANYKLIEGANTLGLDSTDENVADDKIVKGEFHLPVNRSVKFICRSQDVLHGAFLPHFRQQINTVPGMATSMHFVPTITTEEMRTHAYVQKQYDAINKIRKERGQEPVEFNYILLCNKMCGASHYNMQMNIIVETEEEYNAWLAQQPTFLPSGSSAQEPAAEEAKEELAEKMNETN